MTVLRPWFMLSRHGDFVLLGETPEILLECFVRDDATPLLLAIPYTSHHHTKGERDVECGIIQNHKR